MFGSVKKHCKKSSEKVSLFGKILSIVQKFGTRLHLEGLALGFHGFMFLLGIRVGGGVDSRFLSQGTR